MTGLIFEVARRGHGLWGTWTLFYTTSPHEDSFRGAFWSRKCVGGSHPVLTITGGKGWSVIDCAVVCVFLLNCFFSYTFCHQYFCCYCLFYLIAAPINLLFSEPVIFTFCGSSQRSGEKMNRVLVGVLNWRIPFLNHDTITAGKTAEVKGTASTLNLGACATSLVALSALFSYSEMSNSTLFCQRCFRN